MTLISSMHKKDYRRDGWKLRSAAAVSTTAGVGWASRGGFEFLGGVDADGFDGDLLEGELVFGLVEEAEGEGIGLVLGAELDFDGFADELGE